MSKFLSVVIPALALSLGSVATSTAEAAPHSIRPHQAKALKSKAVHKVWVPAHFALVAGKVVWISGRYKVAPRAHAAFVPGHWEVKRGKRVWIPGHWK